MASLRQIRRRMKSITSIHEITKAMEMIAAFRYKKAETRFSRARAYFTEMENMVSHLSSSLRDLEADSAAGWQGLFEIRQPRKKTLVVLTGDKGLCGAYNTNLLRAALQWLGANRSYETYVLPVGKVGCEFFRKKQVPMLASYPEKASADLPMARQMAARLKDLFLEKKTDSVEVLYNACRVGGTGQNQVKPFLGLHYLRQRPKGGEVPDFIYEPDFDLVFLSLLGSYLEGKLYFYLLESLTSEYSARMIAMKQATENAEEVLDSLKLLRNKTRQTTITRELSEIVAGASVLV